MVKKYSMVDVAKAIENPLRKKILVQCIGKEYDLKELQEAVKIDKYKKLFDNLQILLEAGLIIQRKDENARGKPVKVSTNKGIISRRLRDGIRNNKDVLFTKELKDRIDKFVATHNRNVNSDEITNEFKELDLDTFVIFLLVYLRDYSISISPNHKDQHRKENKQIKA